MARTLVLDTIKHPSNSGTANIVLASDETTTLPKVDINSGAIDATTLGAGTPSTVAATAISATGNATVAGTLGVTGNTTLSGSANNLGTVTAGTLGSTVVFPTGFCIKTHYYTDQTGISGYTVTGTTITAMTETLSVSVTSGNTYEITFSGSVIGGVPSSTNQSIGALAMFAASSSTDIGDTMSGTAVTGHYGYGQEGLSSYQCNRAWGDRVHLIYPFVAGSTTTQYFTIAGHSSVGTNKITLNASPLSNADGRAYIWRVKEFQGNCLTENYGG